MASAWNRLSSMWREKLTVELVLKLGALLIAMGMLIGKLNAIDARVGRVEAFLDNHVIIQGKP